MKDRKVMKLASRGKRLGAFCIDFAVPMITSIVFWIALMVAVATYMPSGGSFGYGYGYGYPDFGYGYGYGSRIPGGASAAMIISVLIFIAYTVVQLVLYNKSRTIGKAALGLQVVSSKDGEPIGFWKMLLREWIVKQASGSVFMLGFIWVLIDDKNRGWHDKILDTYVVDIKETEAMNDADMERFGRPAPKSAPLYEQNLQDAGQFSMPDAAAEEAGDTVRVSAKTNQEEESAGDLSRAVSEFVTGETGIGAYEEAGRTENEEE